MCHVAGCSSWCWVHYKALDIYFQIKFRCYCLRRCSQVSPTPESNGSDLCEIMTESHWSRHCFSLSAETEMCALDTLDICFVSHIKDKDVKKVYSSPDWFHVGVMSHGTSLTETYLEESYWCFCRVASVENNLSTPGLFCTRSILAQINIRDECRS